MTTYIRQDSFSRFSSEMFLECFSFLSMSETKEIRGISKSWQIESLNPLNYITSNTSVEPLSLNSFRQKEWQRLSLDERRRLVRQYTIYSLSHSKEWESIAKLFSKLYSGTEHEYLLQLNGWNILQGRLTAYSLLEKVKKDPIWLNEDFKFYFTALAKVHFKATKTKLSLMGWPAKIYPQEANLILNRVIRWHLKGMNKSEILKIAEKPSKEYSKDISEAQFKKLLANTFIELGEIEKAVAMAERASPEIELTYKECAEKCAQQGDVKNAKMFIEKVKSRPDFTYYLCARACAQSGDVENAIAFADKSNSEKEWAYVDSAKEFARQGDTKNAILFADKAGSRKEKAYWALARISAQRGEKEHAITFAEKAGNYQEQADLECAQDFAERNDIDNTIAFAERAGSKKEEASLNCAQTFAQRGDIIHAEFFCKKADSKEAEAYLKCAEAFAWRESAKKAEYFAKKAGNKEAEAYSACSRIFKEQGDEENAAHFAQAKSLVLSYIKHRVNYYPHQEG